MESNVVIAKNYLTKNELKDLEIAEEKALLEFEKYRAIQDKKFESYFDKFLIEVNRENN